jgi:hypothetical protein
MGQHQAGTTGHSETLNNKALNNLSTTNNCGLSPIFRTMSVMYDHGINAEMNDNNAGYREQSREEEADLIPPALLSELPPLHYFARLSGGRTIKGRIPILR